MTTRQRGVTLVELIIVVAIIGIGLALAVPSFTDVRNKRAVTNAAEQIGAFLTSARSEAIRRNHEVTITLDRSVTKWCAGAWCARMIDDENNEVIAELDGGAFDLLKAPVVLHGVAALGTSKVLLTVDPVRGLLDPGNQTRGRVTLTSNNDNYSLRVEMAITGRVDLCTISNKKVPGYDVCGV